MATKEEKGLKDLLNIDSDSTKALMGTDTTLDIENLQLLNLVRQSTNRTSLKLGKHTDYRNLDYLTELGLATMLAQNSEDKKDFKKRNEAKEQPEKYLKKYMSNNALAEAQTMYMSNISKNLAYSNYEAIYKHIPECSTAIRVYTDNILSPDDYNKTIFDFKYDESSDDKKEGRILEEIDDLVNKYKLNFKTSEILEECLIYGDVYYAVLSLEDELDLMLSDNNFRGSLNEDVSFYDKNRVECPIDSNDVLLTEDSREALKEFFAHVGSSTPESDYSKTHKKLTEAVEEDIIKQDVVNFINEHFKIGSKLTMLQERAEYEMAQRHQFDIDREISHKKKGHKSSKEEDLAPMFITGSVIRRLRSDHVIPLDLDDLNYGYYYIEENETKTNVQRSGAGDYLGMVSGRSQDSSVQMASAGMTLPVDRNLGTSNDMQDTKFKLITDVFVTTISKKINKEYIRHNKQFKDFLYGVIKQQYNTQKQMVMTYFTPEEVIHFECEPVFKNIVFFAKLYLAMLTNLMVINLGRGHDKRIITVQTGLDEQSEQALNNVIEAIKTKEFRLSNSDINTVLALNPGAMDDYFVPMVNGERLMDFETLPGMDIDIANNAFLDWLRKSMINGMHLPAALIDSMNDLDFARSLSAQNSNFLRTVEHYQMKLTDPFSRFVRRLYKNEYKYADDTDAHLSERVDVNKIKVIFPSPAGLQMDNLYSRISTADQISDSLSQIAVPAKADGSTEDLRVVVKAEIFKEFLPGVIDWNDIEERIKTKYKFQTARNDVQAKSAPQEDPYGDNSGGYGY